MTAAAAPRRLVLASRNRHKVIEIVELCRGLTPGVELVGIDEVAPAAELREDEPTFEGNAFAKARQAAAATGLPALADDSGLEVDVLMGAPGVRSARYAGEPSDDHRNNDKLLAALAGVPAGGQRSARYRCVAAYVDLHSGVQLMGAGACEGEILGEPRGHGGFGYDPLFLLPSLGKTMAEIDLATKNGLSHRAAAFRALLAQLAARA
jgi:XTP/dITP diphosphohydrolase